MARTQASYGSRTKQQSRFAQIPGPNIPRSRFNRSHGLKTTFNSSYLVPVFVDEALPGDTFSMTFKAFARMTTPLTPVMDNLFMDFFFFAVPNRLLWEHWTNFMGEKVNPGDTTIYEIPQMSSSGGGYGSESIYDYMGIPPSFNGIEHSALPLRAYNLIYNEWFRDQNLIDSVTQNIDDGPDSIGDYTLLKRGKRKDYFTSCLPWPQKGPAVELPLGTTAPLGGNAIVLGNTNVNNAEPTFVSAGIATGQELEAPSGTGIQSANINKTATPAGDLAWSDPALQADLGLTAPGGTAPFADLSTATAATINELRMAFQIQRLYERDARGGTRYTEMIEAHFGVRSPDARLQRPEYLGGGTAPIMINPVAQTSASEVGSPQANLAAIGTAGIAGRGWTKSFTEHMTILGLVCVRADLTYQQGLDRMWSRLSRFDFYFPALSHIGEQAVLNKELWVNGGTTDEDVFGYQERYAEYRYKPSMITGKFRSDDPQSLDVWHLAQDFPTRPFLNQSFIEEDVPVSRILAVQDEPEFLLDMFYSYNCVRPMPTYSVPGLIDHF